MSATLAGAMPTTVDRRRVAAAPRRRPVHLRAGPARPARRTGPAQAALPPITAEAMTGADRRAQALGVPQERLMEHAGTAVAAAVRALAVDLDRWGTGPIVILCGPGNNGGDGYVAARRLALAGASVIVGAGRAARPARGRDRPPGTGTASPATTGITQGPPAGRPRRRDVRARASTRRRSSSTRCSAPGVQRAAARADPVGGRAHRQAPARGGRPGRRRRHPDRGRPLERRAVRPGGPADLTVTFHRPKTGLLTRRGAAHAGKVLVAPIGIPPEADRG